ncbi:MAG: VWA domain-containing protein [Gammaproteobacteria bacterium]|nr:VWA domain-containing protein [Gammaproteobacteria bacterium]
MNRILAFLLSILAISLLNGCSDSKAYEAAMCVLADTSGTYAEEKKNIASITKSKILANMKAGDSMFFMRIDSNSYNEGDLIASMTLDYIPSKANKQKLIMASELDKFAKDKTKSRYTDISGAMLNCTDFLNDTESGNRLIIVFSDMKEELKPGIKRSFTKDQFKNIHFIAMNVIKLKGDSANPEVYREKLGQWEKRTLAAGALSFNVFNDMEKIPEFIEQLR